MLAGLAICNSNSQGLTFTNRDDHKLSNISEPMNANLGFSLSQQIKPEISGSEVIDLLYSRFGNQLPQAQGGDSIIIKKNRYYYQGRPLKSVPAISKVLKPDREAYTKNQTSWAVQIIAVPFAFIGGALIGFSLGSSTMVKETKTKLIIIGAGCVVVAIPLAMVSDKMRRDAIKIYNRNLNKTSFYPEKELRIELMGGGIGLNLRF
jgi:hypothetical protein